MKRFHIHVSVDDLAASTRFYSAMFGAAPAVEKPDYAKWMLDDPRINFAISTRGHPAGLNHLGMQAESADELASIRANLESADRAVVAETNASCCYAKSDKYWVTDPAGIAWESFHTLDTIPTFGAPVSETDTKAASGCCAPKPSVSAKQDVPAGACCG